jgi:hypothetical protein
MSSKQARENKESKNLWLVQKGEKPSTIIRKDDDLKAIDEAIKYEMGWQNPRDTFKGYGALHIEKHLRPTNPEWVTLDEFIRMGDIVRTGTMRENVGKRVYTKKIDGVKFSVIVGDIASGGTIKGERVITLRSDRQPLNGKELREELKKNDALNKTLDFLQAKQASAGTPLRGNLRSAITVSSPPTQNRNIPQPNLKSQPQKPTTEAKQIKPKGLDLAKAFAPIGALGAYATIEANANDNANYGKRADGTNKGTGYLGELKLPNGGVATEYAIGINIDGKEIEIPTLVPTLTKEEIRLMQTDIIPNNKPIPRAILDKAVKHARERIKNGKSPFYSPTISNNIDWKGLGAVLANVGQLRQRSANA